MSELISNTQRFLHKSPIEPINYNDAPEIEKPRDRKLFKKAAALLIGYLAFLGIDNCSYYYDTMHVSADDGSMITDIDGCDKFPRIEHTALAFGPLLQTEFTAKQVKETFDVENEQSELSSAALKFKAKQFNIGGFISDWREIHRNELFSFESSYTGLDVHIYSDGNENPFKTDDIDATINRIDELMNSSLSNDVNYAHVTVDAYKECLRRRFIDEDGPRELEDERLNIYIPSKPGVCFSNGVVQDFPENGDYDEFCDSLGGTYKDVRVRAWPFYEYKRSWMVLMSHHHNPDEANLKISNMLIHEPEHLYMQAAGLPFQYSPNERLADYLEKETISQLYPAGLPLSLEYKQD